MPFITVYDTACVEDRPDTPCLRDLDSPSRCLLSGESEGGGLGRSTKKLYIQRSRSLVTKIINHTILAKLFQFLIRSLPVFFVRIDAERRFLAPNK